MNPRAVNVDLSAVVEAQSQLIGQLQTQLLMRDLAMDTLQQKLDRLNEKIEKLEAEKKPKDDPGPGD